MTGRANILVWPLILAAFAVSGAWLLGHGVVDADRDSALVGGLQLGLAVIGWVVLRRFGISVETIAGGTASVRTYAGRHSLRLADVQAIFPVSTRHRNVIAIRSGSRPVIYVLRGAPGLTRLADAVRGANPRADIRDCSA